MRIKSDISRRSRVRAKLRSLRQNTGYLTAGLDTQVAEVLQKGERIWCKVISVGEDGKVGLSMKHVNQGNGTDLDPNGIELQRDIQRRKNPGTTQRKVIQLEAVLNTTCVKCGTKGHLSKDCFMSPDGKKYELIPEIEEDSVPNSEPNSENTEKKMEKKHKSRKKKRKSKRSKQSTDDSDTEDVEKSKKRKKKISKERKKHRKKCSSSSSRNSSDSSSSDIKAHKRKHSESHETRTKKCKHSKTRHSD
ncbi:nucleolar protein of 40 kDa isoform X2 [Monomorium pharaonis]|uniref:nucleolar protein of 40 kDa isoform X2 n=1 Tax=Monomorium pharaonis TaxID=307658 RepID=UPI00063F2EC6|nr:nucleolar protein of 40 kDa isoform X2 [Monomorium pharaonis]